jgi:hypothetical protein
MGDKQARLFNIGLTIILGFVILALVAAAIAMLIDPGAP